MTLSCVECKPCSCMHGLFKCRRPVPGLQKLRRAFGRMKVAGGGHCHRRRRRRAGSFSSVRAVFWPLMSMRSDADGRNDAAAERPPSAAASTDGGSGGGVRAPSPSLDGETPGVAAPTTAARVLALQARLGEASSPAPVTTVAKTVGSIRAVAARERAAAGGGVYEVEEACRCFERHLMEMLMEERKVMDLTDVEELLCCWEKLRCPAFVQLVGRFYGELCVDLFSDRDTDVASESDRLTSLTSV
ncbi:hypothetical protein ACP4OV_007175 [Aristida adscensionis]